ncbi:MAG: hypothetical protein L0Y66_18240 [Myxococcaceae bacterium]|nr:hypothetical protein [Myxococcaceae bacterium]
MRRFLMASVVMVGLGVVAPAQAASPPLQATSGSSCAKKRTDACGCHHHFGLRHCHPKLKTPRCEAPVRAQAPQPDAGEAREHVSVSL